MRPAAGGLALLALALAAAGSSAQAEDRPGDFDFYVLSLSWSPSYCAAEDPDGSSRQCDGRRPRAFVLHGLWPQYERGYPEYCDDDPDAEPGRRLVDGMLELMPSPGLVRYQWRKHGSCSGLDAADYFALSRKAVSRVRVPPALTAVDRPVTVDPDDVETAFRAANPDLAAAAVAVTCDASLLREVRICLTKDLAFRPCPEVDADGCRRDRVTLPAVR